jgi:hypothetical protein
MFWYIEMLRTLLRQDDVMLGKSRIVKFSLAMVVPICIHKALPFLREEARGRFVLLFRDPQRRTDAVEIVKGNGRDNLGSYYLRLARLAGRPRRRRRFANTWPALVSGNEMRPLLTRSGFARSLPRPLHRKK